MKHGVGGWSKIDIACLVISLIGIVLWQMTNNPTLGLAAAILADFTGTVPTILKTWKRPETEIREYYGMDTLAGILSLFALTSFAPKDIAYPAYIFIINFVMIFICLRKKK